MSGAQRFVCGMRRFDKHRVDSLQSTKENTTNAYELQQRLNQREEDNRILFSSSPSCFPSNVSILPSLPLAEPTSPYISSLYTPWKTPSAIYSNSALVAKK